MQAFIKDNKIVINTMILDNEKEELLAFIEKTKTQNIKATPLYNIEGNTSGIAFSLEEEEE